MSTHSPGELLSVAAAADPESLVEANLAILTRQIWKREATYASGLPTTVKGPPTTGDRVVDEFWRDALGAEYVCTVAGTPGTWKQIRPAVVASNPTGIPSGYWILRSDQGFKHYTYNGATWDELYLALAGGTMTGALVLAADPVAAMQAATRQYVDAIASGARDPKDSCRAATTAALPACTYANGTAGVGATLTADANGALAAQDGVTLVVDDRLLVKNQVAGLQNGLYKVTQVGDGSTPFILTRVVDADEAADVTGGLFTFITEGSTLADSSWLLTTNDPITLGTTALTFVQFGTGGAGEANTASNVGAGTGLFKQKTGVDLEFKSLTAGAGVNIAASGASEVQIKVTLSATNFILGRSSAGAGDVEEIACTSAGRALLDDADAAAQRTTLGLGTAATMTGPSGSIVGTTDAQTLTGKTLTNPAHTSQTLTDGATVNWDMNSGGIGKLTLGGNRAMAAPTNLKESTYILVIKQDATGSRTLTWNAVFKWGAGTAPVLSTAANAIDIITFVYDGTNLYGVAQYAFA